SIGRAADSTFVVVSAGTGAAQVLAFARRLSEQLQNAKITYGNQLLKIKASYGVASLGADAAGSIDELMKLAMQRVEEGVKEQGVKEQVAPQPQPASRVASLPEEI